MRSAPFFRSCNFGPRPTLQVRRNRQHGHRGRADLAAGVHTFCGVLRQSDVRGGGRGAAAEHRVDGAPVRQHRDAGRGCSAGGRVSPARIRVHNPTLLVPLGDGCAEPRPPTSLCCVGARGVIDCSSSWLLAPDQETCLNHSPRLSDQDACSRPCGSLRVAVAHRYVQPVPVKEATYGDLRGVQSTPGQRTGATIHIRVV